MNMPEDLPLNPQNQSNQIKPEFSIPELDSLGSTGSPKKSNKKIILIAVAAIFLLAIIGGLGYYFYSSSNIFGVKVDLQVNEQGESMEDLNQNDLTLKENNTIGRSTFRDDDFGLEFVYPSDWNVIDRRITKNEPQYGGITNIQDEETIGKIYEIFIVKDFDDAGPITEGVRMEIKIKKKESETYANGFLEYNKQVQDEEFAEYQDKAYLKSMGFINEIFIVDGNKAWVNGRNIMILNGNTIYEVDVRLNDSNTVTKDNDEKFQNNIDDGKAAVQVLKDFVETFSFIGDGRVEGGVEVFEAPEEETEEEKLSGQIIEDIKRIKLAFKGYFRNHDSYPSPSKYANRLGYDVKMLTEDGFIEKNVSGLDVNDVYLGSIPSHPKSPNHHYLYYLCDDGDYIIEFYLEEPWEEIPEGKIYSTPGKNFDSASYEIPQSCLNSNSILSSDLEYGLSTPAKLDDKSISEVNTAILELDKIYEESGQYPHKYDMSPPLTYLLCTEDKLLFGFDQGGKHYDYRTLNPGAFPTIVYNLDFLTAIPSECLDLDNDGLSDYFEGQYKTNKNNRDTDGDGFLDGEEVMNGFNPNGPGSL